MAKSKKKKKSRGLAEKVVAKKKETNVETNPFEIHVNRIKHHVHGRKSKNDKGLPGIAREKALQKRKETLLQEYKNRFKANRFRDRRIGESDPKMSVDEKMMARFALELKKRKKKNLFNLNEDEELTHYGQSLAEIEKFDDPRSDEDEDDDKLASEFMKDSHFGGFLTLKEKSSAENEKPKSRKEWIEELIATSKQRKHERQTEREETQEMTEKLDNYWKEVQSLILTQKGASKETKNPEKADSYDVMVRTLKFESRAKASDRLKTPEEIALEEKENLERLETERIRRMQDLEENKSTKKITRQHRSADDLDDNFYLEGQNDQKKVRFLEYKDGKLVSDEEDEFERPRRKYRNTDPEEMSSNSSTENINDKSRDSDNEDGGMKSESDDDDNSDKEEVEEKETSDEDSEDDDYSDIVTDEESDVESKKLVQIKEDEEENKSKCIKSPIKQNEELPYVYSAPSNYEEFLILMKNRSSDDILTIIDRIIKCHHISLAKENKEKLELFFAILLQLVQDLSSRDPPDLKTIDLLAPHLFNLALISPENAGQCMREILKEKYEEFSTSCHFYLSGERGPFPGFDTLIFFKVIAVLFSTSDFHHPVATPAMLFMGQILSKCRVKSLRDAIRGLFVCTIFYEYVSFSKRFVPEAINYLRGILSLCVGNDSSNPRPVIHPFKVFDDPFLKLEDDSANDIKPSPLNMTWLTEDIEITDHVRASVLKITCDLIKSFAQLYNPLTSFREIFNPLRSWWKELPVEKYPSEIKEVIESLEGLMEKPREYVPLKPKKKKPKPLKLLNPKIETNFDWEKRRRGGQQNNEKQRLLHRYKRELKGAMREIRRDNHFLAKQQLDEQMNRDAERKQKVKELYSSLANQEGDYKALVKKKKKAK